MLTREQVRAMREALEQIVAPVLTLYIDINPAQPDNTHKAVGLRVRAALEAIPVPEAIQAQALAKLEELPRGRTQVIIAGADWVQSWHLQTRLPLVDGVEARWGKPYLMPFFYALDEAERFGVVCLSPERARLFEVFWGEVEELPGAFQAVNTKEWRSMSNDSTGRRFTASRSMRAAGGTDSDRFENRLTAWNERFHQYLARELEDWLEVRGITRLALMGDSREIEAFASTLPRPLHERIALKLAGSVPRLTPAAVLKAIGSRIEAFERQWENDLVSDLLSRGVGGLERVLNLLQAGRLRLVVAPWRVTQRVYRYPDGRIQLAETQQSQPVASIPLKDLLPELASARGTRLAFVRDEAETRLLEGLGGLGGLERY